MLAAVMLLSGVSTPKQSYAAESSTPEGEMESKALEPEHSEEPVSEETLSEEIPSKEVPTGGGRSDLDLDDPGQVFRWMEENLPDTLAGLESMPAEWWESLLPNEALTAKVELLYRRFVGDGVQESVADLYEFQAAGMSMDDLLAMTNEASLYTADEKAVLQAVWEPVGHGRVNRKYLNGLIAFCFNEEKHFPNGATYGYKTADEAKISGRLAYIVQCYGEAGVDNTQWWNQNQKAIWAIQAGVDSKEEAEAFARSYCHDRGITDPDIIQDYVQNIGNLVAGSSGKSGTAYLYEADDPENQDIVTYTPVWGGEEPPVFVEPEYEEISVSESRDAVRTHSLSIDSKYASITGETLFGAVFEVYENGQKVGTITTDHSGQGSCSWSVKCTGSATVTKSYCSNYDDLPAEMQATVSGYTSREAAEAAARAEAGSQAAAQAEAEANASRTVSVKEVTVPHGFLETDETQQNVSISGNGSGTLQIKNQPWKARVTLDKVDGVTGSRLTEDAEFVIYEWDGSAYVVSPHYKMLRLADGTYTVQASFTGAEQGYVYYTQKNEGKFYVQEQKAPAGYLKDSEPVYFQITADGQVIALSNAHPENYEINDNTVFANQPAHVKIRVPKIDRYSGNQIADNAEFLVYTKEGGLSKPVTMTKQTDGSYLSSEIYYADTFGNANYGKFYLVEQTAPEGYYGDWQDEDGEKTAGSEANKVIYEFRVESSLSNHDLTLTISNDGEGAAFWNEHIYGEVVLHKYDSEAEADQADGSRLTQGDTKTLDGAVYGLYAAETIVHPDGITGILYEPDELVATAIIGKTPVTDENGYLLDEAGERCIESGKEPAYEETPGKTAFRQVELGSYYISEITPADGYLLDTTEHRGDELTRYPVTFTYTAETEAVVLRAETAQDDGNSLTLDDGMPTHDVYSGDFVQKQAAQFVKLEDLNIDAEKDPLQAGFSIYRLETLSGVADGRIAPRGDVWTKADMQSFLTYDFTHEETALLYKRQSEGWTEADRKWLTATGERANEYRVVEMFSDENGYFCTPELPVGQYILIETTVPEGKRMADPILVTITRDASIPQPVRYIGDETTETYIRIQKKDQDAVEDGFSTVLKPGAKYRIRLLSPAASFDSEVWQIDGGGYLWYYSPALDVRYGTEEAPFAVKCLYKNGKITDAYIELDQLLPVGEYELIEVAAPEGFVISGKEQTLADCSTDKKNAYEIQDDSASKVTFVIDNSTVYPDGQMGPGKNVSMDEYGRLIVTVEQENKEQKGIVEVSKYGEQLYAAEAAGRRLSEKIGPEPFRFLSQTNLWDMADQVFDYQLAPVAGAVFNVYAAEDIYTQQLDRDSLELYADDTSHYLVLHKDELAGTITTDESGFGYLSGLYLGRYYLEEVTAGDGFVLNPRRDEFEITADEPEQNFIRYESSYTNERQKIDLSVTKQDAETEEPLAGAIYGLYTAEDIFSYIRYDEAGDRYLPDPDGRKVISADTLIGTAITGDDGQARFDIDLPLGKYYVGELEAPVGYTTLQEGDRINVDASYAGQDISVQTPDGVVFRNQKTRHVFTKSDIVSGALLSGALLEIREIMVDESGKPVTDEDGRFVMTLVESWISDKDEVHYFYLEEDVLTEIASPEELPEGRELIVKHGHLIEKLQAGRQYLFREVSAPWGYVGYNWSDESVRQANCEENLAIEEIRFTVEDSELVAEHEMKDQRTVGKLAITKEGEFVVAAEKSFLDSVSDFFRTIFGYLFGRIEGVSFDVRVREDIYTPDQTGEVASYYNGREEVLLVKDALVATVTTDVNGIAVLENLPLGTYYITETSTGEGDFLLNREVTEVSLEYPGQEIPVVVHDTTKYRNDRQRVALTVVKKSRYEDEARILNSGETLPEAGSDILVAGAAFGLYTAEDIAGFEVNGQGVVTPRENALLAADTLIEMAATGQDGAVTFLSDLPCGKYYVKELLAPNGYLMSEEVYEFDASYTGPDGSAVIELSCDFYDMPVAVPFSKQDSANGAELAGATLTVTDDLGVIVDEWLSDGTIHYIRNLKPGRRYIIAETKAAPGYAVAESIVFELEQLKDESGRLLQEIAIKTDEAYLVDGVITMKDDRLPEIPDQPDQPGQPDQPHEDRPGEGGGDTGDSSWLVPGLCVLGIGLAGAAGCALYHTNTDRKKKKEDNAENA